MLKMENEEIEAVLEKIWDIHDKLSDAIHSISRSHFLNTIKTLKNSSEEEIYFSNSNGKRKPHHHHHKGEKGGGGGGDDDQTAGYVFMKDVRMDDDAAMAEAKSLNAIRTALENLEDQLEFFHTIQVQQRAERDAAIARLEQSRIILAMRLTDHQGNKYKVIEEALAFIGNIHNASTHFITPQQLFQSQSEQDETKTSTSIVLDVLASSFRFVKRCFKVEQMGGVLGHATLVAVSMVALLHLHHKNGFVVEQEYGKVSGKKGLESGNGSVVRQLDVLAARG